MGARRRAIISVSNKSGAIELGRTLSDAGWEILSTGGTAKELRSGNVPVTDVAAFTGQPEILGGRVKTLHPKLLGGILARLPDQAEEMNANGIDPIDLVAVNLYPFRETISRPGVSPAEALEQIDIGGPTMVRAAAKNHPRVTVLVDPGDYHIVIKHIENKERIPADLNRRLAKKAFRHVSHYDAAISIYLDTLDGDQDDELFPIHLSFCADRMQTLRYGENPHQRAAFYRLEGSGSFSLADAEILGGKELSYNNLLDLAAAAELVSDIRGIGCVIIKHTNPSGVGVGVTPASAYERALACDPVSAFGSIISFNCEVDLPAAEEMRDLFVEAVIAPGFTPEALALFRKKKNLRILRFPNLVTAKRSGFDIRSVPGGLLVQDPDRFLPDEFDWKVVTSRAPTAEEEKALLMAWTVTRHVKSNAIVLADQYGTIGVGAGQMSRVDAARLAVERAQLPTAGCAMGSDAFFPFRDGLDEAAKCGVRAVVQPGGSKRDDEVIQAAEEHDIAMVFTGHRHFRH